MLSRICYAFKTCKQHITELHDCLSDPSKHLISILALSPRELYKRRVEILVLDFDGVLASHAEPVPLPAVAAWLKDFVIEFPANKIYILSNKPTAERIEYFAKNFPQINFIVATRKKPYPDGLLQVIEHAHVASQDVLLVDDRLATGIIAAICTKVQYIWITHAYTNLAARPIRECFFKFLRWFEKFTIKHSQWLS